MENEVIFISGGTGKIGSQLVREFLKCNYVVITASRSFNNLESLKKELTKKQSDRFFGIHLDLEGVNAVDVLLSWFANNKLFPSVLVNNARNMDYLSIENGITKDENWLGEFYLDVIIPYKLSVQLSNHPMSRLRKIINVSSMYGVVAVNPSLYDDFTSQSPINYGVCKAALIHLTRELAVRLAHRKIDVNAVSFGGVEGRVDGEFIKRYSKLTPQGRMLNDGDVVGSILFLASDASNGMTGQNLIIDGGWTIW